MYLIRQILWHFQHVQMAGLERIANINVDIVLAVRHVIVLTEVAITVVRMVGMVPDVACKVL